MHTEIFNDIMPRIHLKIRKPPKSEGGRCRKCDKTLMFIITEEEYVEVHYTIISTSVYV